MRIRTLFGIGLVVGLVGVVGDPVITSLGDSDETAAVGLIVADCRVIRPWWCC